MARDMEIQDEARADMLAACAKWLDQWDGMEGALVTGFVVIVESIVGQDQPLLTFASGDGSPVHDQSGGLSRWRIDGMCREVSNEMTAIILKYRIEQDSDAEGQ